MEAFIEIDLWARNNQSLLELLYRRQFWHIKIVYQTQPYRFNFKWKRIFYNSQNELFYYVNRRKKNVLSRNPEDGIFFRGMLNEFS